MSSVPVFHIVAREAWDAARARGTYAPESLTSEGFVHLSYADQVADSANAFFLDDEDLIVVEFDPALLPGEVVAEDSYGSGQTFPHIYAAIPVTAAVAVHPLPRGVDHRYSFSV